MCQFLRHALGILLLACLAAPAARAQLEPLSYGRQYTSPDLPPGIISQTLGLRNGDALIFRYDYPNQFVPQPAPPPPPRLGACTLLRVDSNGHPRWSKRILASTADTSAAFYFNEAVELPSGKIILSGLSGLDESVMPIVGHDFTLLCLSPDGQVLWCRKGHAPDDGSVSRAVSNNLAVTPNGDGVWCVLCTSGPNSLSYFKVDTLGQVVVSRIVTKADWNTLTPIGVMASGTELYVYGNSTWTDPMNQSNLSQTLALRATDHGIVTAAVATPIVTDTYPFDFGTARIPGRGIFIKGLNPFMSVNRNLAFIGNDLQKAIYYGVGDSASNGIIYAVADGRSGVNMQVELNGVSYLFFVDSNQSTGPHPSFSSSLGGSRRVSPGGTADIMYVGGIESYGYDRVFDNTNQYSIWFQRPRYGEFAGCSGSGIGSPVNFHKVDSVALSPTSFTQAAGSVTLQDLPYRFIDFPLCEFDHCNWHLSDTSRHNVILDSSGTGSVEVTISDWFYIPPGQHFLWSNGDTTLTTRLPVQGRSWLTMSGTCGSFRYTYDVQAVAPHQRIGIQAGGSLIPAGADTLALQGPQTIILYPLGSVENPQWISPASTLDSLEISLTHDTTLTLALAFTDPATGLRDTVYRTIAVDLGVTTGLAPRQQAIKATPNIVTLNGDGLNEAFIPDARHPGGRLTVYNRWANTVYDKDGYQADWPVGDVPAGTYYYRYQTRTGKMLQGWVEVVR